MDRAAVTAALRAAGARFALVHGSRAGGGRPRADSDLDVGAWWGTEPPDLYREHRERLAREGARGG